MKIIGWTDWDNPNYEDMFPVGGPYRQEVRDSRIEVSQVQQIIAEELRNRGFKFTGDYHQNGDYGVPVFDNGMVYQCSQRTWGGIMADAYPEEIDNTDGYGYLKWAWVAPEPMIVPDERVL